MKTTLAPLVCLCLILAACQREEPHQYVVERVKDINGNDCFLRIDLTTGDECVVGHGWAVNRLMKDAPPEMGYVVPHCQQTPSDAGKK